MEEQIQLAAKQFLKLLLKPDQLKTLQSYCGGRDTIFIAPTGYGKSLIYQLGPFLLDPQRYKSSSYSSFSNNSTKSDSLSSTGDFLTTDGQHQHVTSTPVRPAKTINVHTDPAVDSSFSNTSSIKSGSIPSTSDFLTTDDQHDTSTPVRPARNVKTDPAVEDVSSHFSQLDFISAKKLKPDIPTVASHSQKMAQFLIIMPLMALIDDAIRKCKEMMPQVSTVHLCAATVSDASSAVMIFTSPESIVDGTGRRLLQKQLNISAVFVDEFHIVERWGTSMDKSDAFRAAYGQIGELRALIRNAPFVCLSATATDNTISVVKNLLRLVVPNIIKVSINKPNITYHCIRVTGNVLKDFAWLVELINKKTIEAIPRMIFFFNNINKLVDAYQYVTVHTLQEVGTSEPSIVMFHLITNSDIKDKVVGDLGEINGKVKCVFSSSSLSMGMNLSNIEYVIHYGPPMSCDSFLQETGRAAREPSLHGHSILLTFPRMAAGRQLDETMKSYLNPEKCRREILLSKFKCAKPADQLMCCDVCQPEITCQLKQSILTSFEDSITDSFSDSLSLASLEDIPDLDLDD